MEKLRGTNRIEWFSKNAELIKSKIVSHGGVSGIIFIGGLVRGLLTGTRLLTLSFCWAKETKD